MLIAESSFHNGEGLLLHLDYACEDLRLKITYTLLLLLLIYYINIMNQLI
jgi:hypothetical protein